MAHNFGALAKDNSLIARQLNWEPLKSCQIIAWMLLVVHILTVEVSIEHQ